MSKRLINFKTLFFSTIFFIIITAIISINAGYIQIPLHEVIAALLGNGTDQNELTIFQFRLPRIFMALLVGMGISLSGAILQGVTQNPLADPGILGINSGAGFAVVLYMFFFQGASFLNGWASVYVLPITALAGAFLTAVLIYFLSRKNGHITPIRLLLMGIGMNGAFNAGILIFQMKMEPNDFTRALTWLSGAIWGANWNYVWALLPWLLILIPIAIYKSKVLDILLLGDSTATGVGINVARERKILLIIAVTLAGVCVAIGGGITFLGLLAPHITRQLVGPKHSKCLPLTAALGSFILLAADTLGRVIMAPSELPVGIVVSILGAPYFIYLLIKSI
ncbi:FecCD family ABC transporter permease [Aeribacillus sp. SP014]|jgi:iron complex transport system permease protein